MSDQSAEARLRAALQEVAAHETLDKDGNYVCWIGESTMELVRAALAATPAKPSASKRDKGWRYKWNDEKKLMEFSDE